MVTFRSGVSSAPAKVVLQASEAAVAAKLWDISERLTGARFDMSQQEALNR